MGRQAAVIAATVLADVAVEAGALDEAQELISLLPTPSAEPVPRMTRGPGSQTSVSPSRGARIVGVRV